MNAANQDLGGLCLIISFQGDSLAHWQFSHLSNCARPNCTSSQQSAPFILLIIFKVFHLRHFPRISICKIKFKFKIKCESKLYKIYPKESVNFRDLPRPHRPVLKSNPCQCLKMLFYTCTLVPLQLTLVLARIQVVPPLQRTAAVDRPQPHLNDLCPACQTGLPV